MAGSEIPNRHGNSTGREHLWGPGVVGGGVAHISQQRQYETGQETGQELDGYSWGWGAGALEWAT